MRRSALRAGGGGGGADADADADADAAAAVREWTIYRLHWHRHLLGSPKR